MKCERCGELKNVDEFIVGANLSYYCKDCRVKGFIKFKATHKR